MKSFHNKHVLVTAGPTYEQIDPVRYIGNFSSGKMGFAIAEAFANAGAVVTLISGPVSIPVPPSIKQYIPVRTADDMYNKCLEFFPFSEIAVLAAAVADYRPADTATQKIKSQEDDMQLTLVKNTDIAKELGKIKTGKQFIAGFALETHDELDNARQKLKEKNFDLIILNSLNDEGAGFGFDTNKITIIDKDNKTHNFGLKTKTDLAKDILELIAQKIS